MCRLAAFPPGFPRDLALRVLESMWPHNVDGTGSVYIKNGEFVVNKWPYPFSRVRMRGLPLLDHMPYNGWTVAHLRAASHGKVSMVNTHPFVKDGWAIVHNGIWQLYGKAKSVIEKEDADVKFDGETDSEVAATCVSLVGPRQFHKVVSASYSGVYLCLKRTGALWVVKSGWSLSQANTKFGVLLASELPRSAHPNAVSDGWIRLNSSGAITHQHKHVNEKATILSARNAPVYRPY